MSDANDKRNPDQHPQATAEEYDVVRQYLEPRSEVFRELLRIQEEVACNNSLFLPASILRLNKCH